MDQLRLRDQAAAPAYPGAHKRRTSDAPIAHDRQTPHVTPQRQQSTALHEVEAGAPMSEEPTRLRQVLRFLQHFGEMLLAMLLGMGAFNLLNGAILVPLGFPYLSARLGYPEAYALAMAVAMTAPMVAWMRIRKHAWRLSAEMAGAMIVPVVVLVAVCAIGLLPHTFAVPGTHILMVPAMLGAMLYRRRDYSCH